jgi:uncharacterized protein YggU (UPF0235/DUF167 family)
MYIKIDVKAGAREELFEQLSADSFRISIKEPAKQNLANKRIVELVREKIGKGRGMVRIISGHHSPSKIISID